MVRFEAVSKSFGGLKVIQCLDMTIPDDTIFGLIGPNGAGKTTVFNLVTGLLRPSTGKISYREYDLTSMPSYRITDAGIARTFQNIRVFPEMSLVENVVVGMHDRLGYGLGSLLLLTPSFRKKERAAYEEAHELLSWVRLEKKALDPAGSLPYGEQRKLELVRALATKPNLLLLDEPVAGMNHDEKAELSDEIRNIRDRGYGIILIDHDMKFVMGLCREIAVLNFGTLIARGTPEHIRNNPIVIEAYLGKEGGARNG
jgi:branched-chain amino acid transport system ATP-binding protein